LNDQPADAPDRAGDVAAVAPPRGFVPRGIVGLSLPMRLLALFLLCLLPVIAVEIATNADLRARRQAELNDLAMRQAELAGSDMGSVVDGAQQLMQTIAQFPSLRAEDPACGADLAVLQRMLPAYAFIGATDANGVLLCASKPEATGIAAAQWHAWMTDTAQAGGAAVGRYAMLPDGLAFLPIIRATPARNAGGGAIVAALDLRWLDQHLADLWRSRTPLYEGSMVVVTDWDGTVLSRYPEDTAWIGRRLPEAAMGLVGEGAPGIAALRMPDGESRMAAYVPATVPPIGLATLVFVSQAVVSGFDISGVPALVLFAGAALLALALTVFAGRRLFVRPMERLLHAAQRWRDGDLGARADLGESRSGFARLAASFNQMASALQVRDAELRTQAEVLEAQVAARTRALAASNNRLQVEVAEREKTEAALHQAQKLQAVGQLAGGIAHDFNNMLATVLGSLELMERRIQNGVLGADAEENKRQLVLIERASDAVQRGAQLTSRLLAFSRRQRLAVRPTDLNRLIADLLTLATGSLGRGVRVRTVLAEDLWPALADPSQVEAAILNLCLNARDAMPGGGELAIATGHETVTPDRAGGPAPGDYVRITVSDTGGGMTGDVQARAFDPFFTTKGPGGTGLGLSQVYGVARQSGGAVTIESAPGQGTTIALLLPRAAGPAVAPERRGPHGTDHPVGSRPRVMVVDDDAAVRRATADMLRDLGCDVLEAPGASDALAQLDAPGAALGLILIDYIMPGLNGIELARAIRDRGIGVPLVLATGYAELGGADHTDLLAGLLRKPFTIAELQAVLRRLHGGATAEPRVVPLRESTRRR
jgi:signal transduction histidine kinase/ActR/RegA family two-component response regulator